MMKLTIEKDIPETTDTMMAGWMVLAVISAFVALNTVCKFCEKSS